MSWRLEVHHKTAYQYAGQVASSYNEARLTPMTSPRQTVLSTSLEVSPRVTPYRYVDSFGTTVHAFDLHQPHDHLSVIGHSVTETMPATAVTNRASWADLRSPMVMDKYCDYLALTRLVDVNDDMLGCVEELGGRDDPGVAVGAVFDAVRGQLSYTPGSTAVSTTASDAFVAGNGVCQDFVHVSLALLRAMGIPARYVSGYVHNRPDAMVGETVRGESHAWVDVWTGDWWGFDPTGNVAVGERHIVIASGRDYHDVTPLKGVFAGAKLERLEVGVELVRRA